MASAARCRPSPARLLSLSTRSLEAATILKFGATHVPTPHIRRMGGMMTCTLRPWPTRDRHRGYCTASNHNYLILTQNVRHRVLTPSSCLVDNNVHPDLAMLTLMQKNLQSPSSVAVTRSATSPNGLPDVQKPETHLDDMIPRQFY